MADVTETTVTTTETVEQPGTKPETQAAETPEQLHARIAELERHATNKEQEAERNRKKLEKFEQADQERANAQLTKEQLLEKRATEAEARAETATAEASAKLLKAAVLLKAGAMGFEHPADAVALAKDEGALSKLEPGEDGEYDEKAIEAALKPLIGRLPVKQQGSGVGSAILRPGGLKPVDNKKPVAGKPTRY